MNFKQLKPETRDALRAFHTKARTLQSDNTKLTGPDGPDMAKKVLSQRAARSARPRRAPSR